MTESSQSAAPPRRILVVEDEYLLADDLRRDLERAGAQVLGPVASVAEALRLLDAPDPPDAAVLDVNLGGEAVFPLARTLRSRGVPFLFVTGFDSWSLPRDMVEVPCFSKPVEIRLVLRTLGLPQPPGIALRA